PYIGINPISIIIQMAAKTIVAGASGMLFAAIYLKTKNIWTCVIVHALNDFFLFLQEAFSKLGTAMPTANYVHVYMEMTHEQIIFYLLMILRVLPNIIIAIFVIRKLNPKECVFWK
ncbi:MAG: CPBP family intramembrane glutamic endopeptidase, partial [Lachnospiraceae bacterium]|nr:CPBP family intramembrane glutamic endopeptidase [Lachnospiraceae bacterium]